ncbi:MAG: Na+/H+ antiporter subunit C [Tepidiforma sp.]
MELLLAVTVGWLYACGLYLLLRRTLAQVVIGLALLTNGTNLLIFVAAGLVRGEPPLIGDGEVVLAAGTADPLPQALILTAIVIGFAIQAFAMALAYRVYRSVGSDDIDALTTTEPPPPPVAVQTAEGEP